jgi:two-component system sensor histidine kinase AlgZ
MREPQILSVFHDTAATPAENAAPPPLALVFDACHVGVVLRAVLFVQAVMVVPA